MMVLTGAELIHLKFFFFSRIGQLQLFFSKEWNNCDWSILEEKNLRWFNLVLVENTNRLGIGQRELCVKHKL